MRGQRIFWQLFPSYVFITLAALVLVVSYGNQTLQRFHSDQSFAALESSARIFAAMVTPERLARPSDELDRLAKELGRAALLRITVVDLSGNVIADSEEAPSLMDNHGDRVEIATALATRAVGRSMRFSDTVKANMAYVAVPVLQEGRTVAVVRTARRSTAIDAVAADLQRRIAAAGMVAILLITVLSWWLARRISRPLERMSEGAARFARGDLEHRLRVEGSQEIATLAEAMNEMASQLDERITTIVRQREEQDAILDSMVEGVLALDSEGRILGLNPACSRMFRLDPAAVRGRPVHEVLRKADLLAFVEEAISSPVPLHRDVVIREQQQRHFTARGTALFDRRQRRIGVLIVLDDVTRLRQLENVRRDFVANASHELRTPVTSIKGFVETLLDGALEDRESAERFLRIILNQSDRLDALVNDILCLAKIEKEAEDRTAELFPGRLADVLDSVIEALQPQAKAKQIRLVRDGEADLEARINPRLLEQAVTNLVDNALKYSPYGSEVRVQVRRQMGGAVIEVIDQGPGIEAKHFPRLFERFYRVDKARSDRLGGTGLGLAIVKHIAAVHGGSVSVDSRIGEGSTFRIHLP